MNGRLRTVVLTERRTAVRRLPAADVEELIRFFRHVVEVTPSFGRGRYRLIARGYVGSFRTANLRWEVHPKLPWESLHWLTGPRSAPGGLPGDRAGSVGGLADLLATRLTELIRERAADGILRDYAERETEEPAVRGRLDLPRQLRGTRTPSLFHLIADDFTADNVWNRLPKAAARRLLDLPGLSKETRNRLANTLTALDGVSDSPPSAIELEKLVYDSRTEPYRPLVAFSRLVLGDAAITGAANDTSFLVNLEHLFQQYVGAGLSRPGALKAGWSVESQPAVSLSSTGPLGLLALRPDLLVRDPRGQPASVWDAKWKSLTSAGPHPADVHQALGYAAVFGLRSTGLVYPGRRFAIHTYTAPGSAIRLRIVRLRLVGTAPQRERSLSRLARLVQQF